MRKIKGAFAITYDSFIERESLLPLGLADIVRSVGAKKILDFGCGTGSVAIGLSIEGYDVTAVDFSPAMLKRARAKAVFHQANVRFVNSDIISVKLNREFDLLLCLGNTLPLIHRLSDSRRFLKNCVRHLNPDGAAIFQLLNYDRILRERPRTFAMDTTDETIRIKQYRYGKDLVDFVVTIVDSRKIPPQISTSKRKIRPWTRKELICSLMDAGFRKASAFGSYSGDKFTIKSKDLVVIARS